MPMSRRLLRPLARGGFDPRSIPDLSGWWDFGDAASLGSASSGAGGVSNNGPVKFVTDKSGSGRHMIQSGADSIAPTYSAAALNGRSVLLFDGGDYLLCNSALSFSEQTVFAVFRLQSTATNFARIYTQAESNVVNSDGVGSSKSIPLMRNAGGQSLCSFDGGVVKAVVSVSYNTWQIISSQRSGGLYSNRVNNGAESTSSTGSGSLSFVWQAIGSGIAPGSEYFRDGIAEVIMYTRGLTATERTSVASYLGSKWGITVS